MKNPVYILGPCSAESREQVLETAHRIQEVCGGFPYILRAGVWKPRTSPRTFQGVGEKGLLWLIEAKQTYDVEVATEVATPEHVRLAAEAGIDYLWIGARTSANPMAVSAIAKAITERIAIRPRCCKTANAVESSQGDCTLKGIFIKNPVNEDAALWLGNIERLEKAGIPVIAVHRGCNHMPCWSMAHAVRQARPDIPMLLDPSHMSGNAAQVPALTAKIPELGLDGAMIEVHCHPDQAFSDAKQQITPAELATLLKEYRVQNTEYRVQNTELNWLRAEIDEIDNRLWATISERMDVSRRIGEWKKTQGLKPLQPGRYQEIVKNIQRKGEQLGLPQEFMLQIWDLIHTESLRRQEN